MPHRPLWSVNVGCLHWCLLARSLWTIHRHELILVVRGLHCGTIWDVEWSEFIIVMRSNMHRSLDCHDLRWVRSSSSECYGCRCQCTVILPRQCWVHGARRHVHCFCVRCRQIQGLHWTRRLRFMLARSVFQRDIGQQFDRVSCLPSRSIHNKSRSDRVRWHVRCGSFLHRVGSKFVVAMVWWVPRRSLRCRGRCVDDAVGVYGWVSCRNV
jgi:hypothetical protein